MKRLARAVIYASYVLAAGFSILIFITGLVFCVKTRFAHPELTETQLFLKSWETYLGCGIFGFVSMFFLTRDVPWKKGS